MMEKEEYLTRLTEMLTIASTPETELSAETDHVSRLHWLLGLVPDDFVSLVRSAASAYPKVAQFQLALGWCYHLLSDREKNLEQAEACYIAAYEYSNDLSIKDQAAAYLSLMHLELWLQHTKDGMESDAGDVIDWWQKTSSGWAKHLSMSFGLPSWWTRDFEAIVKFVSRDERKWRDCHALGKVIRDVGGDDYDSIFLLKYAYEQYVGLEEHDAECLAELAIDYLAAYADYLYYYYTELDRVSLDPGTDWVEKKNSPVKFWNNGSEMEVVIGEWTKISPLENWFEAFKFIGATDSVPIFQDTVETLIKQADSVPNATYIGDALVGFLNFHRELLTVHKVQELITCVLDSGLVDDSTKACGRLHHYLGSAFMDAGRYDDAGKHLEMAHEILEEDNDVKLQLGTAYALTGRVPEASRLLMSTADTSYGAIMLSVVNKLDNTEVGNAEKQQIIDSLLTSRHNDATAVRCQIDFGHAWEGFPTQLRDEIVTVQGNYEDWLLMNNQSPGSIVASMGRLAELSVRVCFLLPFGHYLDTQGRSKPIEIDHRGEKRICRGRCWQSTMEDVKPWQMAQILRAASKNHVTNKNHPVLRFLMDKYETNNYEYWLYWVPKALDEIRWLRNADTHNLTESDHKSVSRCRSMLWSSGLLYALGKGRLNWASQLQ